MDELLDVIDVLGVTHIGGLDGWNNVLPQMMDTITTQYYSHQVQTTKSVREVSSSMLLVPLMSCTETDSMDEDFDSSGVTRENIDVSHDYQGRREEKRRRLEAIDQDHNYFIPARDKTSDMGDRRTIPRAVQKRRADRTLVLGVEDSGSEGTLESLDSQDHHISIDESDSGEESSTSSDSNTLVNTDKKDGATGASIKKPVCLVEYSRKMRPFDKANMLVENVVSISYQNNS
ncbi:hypothetical protein Pmani_001759 [Petrolisthes manimaculis]|uniref:Uncharacterized protein n=1 Tax=Petrolisthes manimaculis TaxID=1843537 RepID=A0AAE1QIX2_9EUCA|nr:hypothetical protein Pmani_001759 [Petrolisthes manimaculis]